jgi:subtilisin family serine protease
VNVPFWVWAATLAGLGVLLLIDLGIVDRRPHRIGGGSVTLSGTSMANPHVTGVAALYKQTYGDRSQGEIMQWLWSQATPNRVTSMPASTPTLLLYSPL